MEPHELQEQTEHAHHSGEKAIGLTMAVVAVLLALATLQGHRAHSEEILSLTQNVDDWDFYQAKHNRAYTFALAAETEALLPDGKESALRNLKASIDEECGVPPIKDCTSPLLRKNSASPVLQRLVAESKPAAGDKTEATEPAGKDTHPATTGATEPSAGKHEKPTKEAGGKEGAVQIQERATERQKEVKVIEHKTDFYDGSEHFLDISIVLCSIALLAENRLYWKLSFISTVMGIAVAIFGMILK